MDALKPFLNRIAQPVILSFCISWILWNWEVVIALLWYDAETIKATNSSTHMEYIKLHANGWKNYVLPLSFALFFLPVRYGVNWLNAFFRTKERSHVLQVTGTGKMSTLRFLELKKSYDDRIASISEFIDKEADIQKKLNEAESELMSLRSANADVGGKYSLLKLENEGNLNRLANLTEELIDFKHKSSPEFLLGTYNYVIYEKDHNGHLTDISTPIFNGIAHFKMHNNDYNFHFITDSELIIGIDHYFYNVLSESLLLKFTIAYTQNISNTKFFQIISKLNEKFILVPEFKYILNIKIDNKHEIELRKTS